MPTAMPAITVPNETMKLRTWNARIWSEAYARIAMTRLMITNTNAASQYFPRLMRPENPKNSCPKFIALTPALVIGCNYASGGRGLSMPLGPI